MSDGTFLAYTAFLFVSGITLVVLAAGGFGQSAFARVVDGLFGVGFIGYAVYLLFFFEGGHIRVFFYAFVVPVLAIIHAVKARKVRREQQAQFNYAYAPQYVQPGQPTGYAAPQVPYHAAYPAPEATPGQPNGHPAPQPTRGGDR